MLDSLYIKNFRLFNELTIEKLGRVKWIYGSYANPAVLEKIISQRDENWEKRYANG